MIRAKVTAWAGKSGEPAGGLSLTIDELVTLRGKPKPHPDRRQAADKDDAGVWRS